MLAIGASIPAAQAAMAPYQIGVDRLSCGHAATLFAAFLNDYDGRLPAGWRMKVRGSGRGLFTWAGSRSRVSVTFAGTGGATGGPVGTLACPNLFTVLNKDAIGPLSLPAGRYRLTRLSPLSPSCGQIPELFRTFLDDPDGILPDRWKLLAQGGAFVKGSLSYGFTVQRSIGA
ncbi:MAG: hypothetical protein M3376_06710 [Actinomycetota bacterium]|nr:hypothetical protein [Actinomycetota bacterium]